jgi:hypothetical protein
MKSVTRWTDIVALSFWLNVRSKFNWSVSILVAAAIAWDVVSPRLEQGQSFAKTFPLFFSMLATLMTLILLVGFLAIPLIASTNFLRKGSIGPREFTVTSEALVEDDGRKTTAVSWRDVRSIDKTRRHIFVRISSWKYMLLSLRDFQGEPQFAQYYADLVNAKHANT